VPRVVGPIRRLRLVEMHDVEFLRANTDRPPDQDHAARLFKMAQQAQNDHTRPMRASLFALTGLRSTRRPAI
jgi:hypothetical protein